MKAWLFAIALAGSPLASAGQDVTAQAKTLMRAGVASQPQARALFEQAAGQGSGPAAYYLGLMHKNGMGGPQDSAAALRWLELAAQRGVAPAMFIVANLLLESDEEKARFWLDAACDAQYPEALQQKSIALGEGTMGYAHNEEQASLYLKMATHAMGHRPPEP
ncbi:tetratricopeptide repeat protein [Janthinobacterium sp. UMAB-56]|uniref:tetratricopeptide repeat protein n=1 Tax=Janthinobacterium sp. UMAB-56 TaxID=1365361 RepID=UPI001C56BF2B|nr:SEL1-like repeat protein [Janthinobacterium sp. UMAB-56]